MLRGTLGRAVGGRSAVDPLSAQAHAPGRPSGAAKEQKKPGQRRENARQRPDDPRRVSVRPAKEVAKAATAFLETRAIMRMRS